MAEDSDPELETPVKDSKKRKSLDSGEKKAKKVKKEETPKTKDKKDKKVETPKKEKKDKETETPKKDKKQKDAETPKKVKKDKKEVETPKKEQKDEPAKKKTKKKEESEEMETDIVPSGTVNYALNAICKPLAPPNLSTKCLKLTQKAASSKQIRRGVKEVVKALRKNERGLCLLAGDISPVEVICHIPIICEEAGLPYIYVPSKSELGVAASTKRPTSVVLISDKTPEIGSEITSLAKEIQKVPSV